MRGEVISTDSAVTPVGPYSQAVRAGDLLYISGTVPIDPRHRPQNMTVLPISGLLAETIMNVFSDDSVSAIFGGDTQLF